MAVNAEVWESHKDELRGQIEEIRDVNQIENLVRTLENKYLVDSDTVHVVVSGMSRHEVAEMVVETVGRKVASDPTAFKSFLDVVKPFGMQTLAQKLMQKLDQSSDFEIRQKLNARDSWSLPPPPNSQPSSPSHGQQSAKEMVTGALNAPTGREGFVTGAASVQILPGFFYPHPDKHLSEEQTCKPDHPSSTTSMSPPDDPNLASPYSKAVDNETFQGVPPNDSGLVCDLSESSSPFEETITLNHSSIPPVQRSLSGTSDGSDNGQLEGLPSPIRRTFQKMKTEYREMKTENRELRKQNWELKRESQGAQNAPVQVHDKEISINSPFPVQEDVEIPHNIPIEVQEYIRKLQQEREFLRQKATETEQERDRELQDQVSNTKKWIQTVISSYHRRMYDIQRIAIRYRQQRDELARQIEVATDPRMDLLRSRMGSEQEKKLKEQVTEMEAEIAQLKCEVDKYEMKMQETEQQQEEVVTAVLQKFYLHPSGKFDSVFAHYLARNNEECGGTKCKVCLQQLGRNQKYCQKCLPIYINQKDHNKLKVHEFKTLKTANSHIYSEAVLQVACGGNNGDILRVHLTPVKFITPKACFWHLPECTLCDSSTSDLEDRFKGRYESGYHHPSVVGGDAVLFYIYIHRGLAVNVNLMHYLFCSNCTQHLPGIRNVLELAWEFRRTIIQSRNQEDKKTNQEDKKTMESKATENLLFHRMDIFPGGKYLIEFPFVCVVDSCALIYAQIPPCCWAVPLDPSSEALPVLRENFPNVVERINRKLSMEREQSLNAIEMEGTFPKLVVRYLPECCLKI